MVLEYCHLNANLAKKNAAANIAYQQLLLSVREYSFSFWSSM